MLRTLLRNVLSNWAGFLVEACVAFYLSPFVIHTLGDTSYGIWILLTSLTCYFGILNGGGARRDGGAMSSSYSWPLFIARGAIAVAVYAPVAFFACLSAPERGRAYGFLRQLFGTLAAGRS
jgi:hypothetical protein